MIKPTWTFTVKFVQRNHRLACSHFDLWNQNLGGREPRIPSFLTSSTGDSDVPGELISKVCSRLTFLVLQDVRVGSLRLVVFLLFEQPKDYADRIGDSFLLSGGPSSPASSWLSSSTSTANFVMVSARVNSLSMFLSGHSAWANCSFFIICFVTSLIKIRWGHNLDTIHNFPN